MIIYCWQVATLPTSTNKEETNGYRFHSFHWNCLFSQVSVNCHISQQLQRSDPSTSNILSLRTHLPQKTKMTATPASFNVYRLPAVFYTKIIVCTEYIQVQLKVWNAYSKKQQFTTGLRKKHMESNIFPFSAVTTQSWTVLTHKTLKPRSKPKPCMIKRLKRLLEVTC